MALICGKCGSNNYYEEPDCLHCRNRGNVAYFDIAARWPFKEKEGGIEEMASRERNKEIGRRLKEALIASGLKLDEAVKLAEIKYGSLAGAESGAGQSTIPVPR